MTPPKATVADAPETVIPDSKLLQDFKAARRVSTPIVGIETPDPAATISDVRRALAGQASWVGPICQWDIVRGVVGINDPGKVAAAKLGDPDALVNPTNALVAIEGLPQYSVVFFHNIHKHLQDPAVTQAIWNLRDTFKVNRRMLVMLAPNFKMPAELAGDVIVLDEPLPKRAELETVLDQQHKNANLPAPTGVLRRRALDAVVGLPKYTTEQVIAMALTKDGVDHNKLWDRKIKAIQNTDGLRVLPSVDGDTTFKELQGIDNAAEFMQMLIDAEAFGAIVFIDEGDKAFAGGMSDHTGDSGVSKDQVGTVLSYMEETKSLGVLLAGVAGTGKTQLARATGFAAGKPVIVFDLGGMKGGTVGQSEAAIRAALKVVTATAEGRVLFLMTANKTTLFTPELNRRFPDQFFFDTPDDAGRKAIWPVYIKKFGLRPDQAKFKKGFDAGWTGAEIRRACDRAALFNCTVEKAGRHIIPQSVSGKDQIAALRRNAEGRFLSASYDGYYRAPSTGPEAVESPERTIDLG